jgi:hypothetical protein
MDVIRNRSSPSGAMVIRAVPPAIFIQEIW